MQKEGSWVRNEATGKGEERRSQVTKAKALSRAR